MMKRWLVFLLAAVIFAVVHEGMHIVMAAFYGEYAALRIHYGVFPEVNTGRRLTKGPESIGASSLEPAIWRQCSWGTCWY